MLHTQRTQCGTINLKIQFFFSEKSAYVVLNCLTNNLITKKKHNKSLIINEKQKLEQNFFLFTLL